jgi:hypothetical protein
MDKPKFYSASDYAGLNTKDASFYYGYEYSICHICGKKNNGEYCDDHPESDRDWCFTASFDGKEIVIPFQKLQHSDMFDVVGCLLVGIGWVLAKRKASRSACQNSLYWAWLTDCEKTTVNVFAGNDAEWWHKNFKHRYLCPIFIRDDINYAEMITVLHDIKDIDGYELLRDGIINLTSTTKCSVGQFSEYLGKIERFCHERGISLRTDDFLYNLTMGK